MTYDCNTSWTFSLAYEMGLLRYFRCSFDVLELFDGNSTLSRSIGKYCGNSFNPVTSGGRYITLEFTTDDSTQQNGFKIFYNFTTTRIGEIQNFTDNVFSIPSPS